MLGLLGATSAGLAMAPALRVLAWPLLGLNVVLLGRGWYLNLSHGGWQSTWNRGSRLVLLASTVLVVVLWTLRLSGVLGMSPI